MSYKLSSPSTSNGGYTESDVVGAKMSCLANAHDLSNMSYKLSSSSTSNGRYAERDLVGAEMSCLANAHDLSSKLSSPSTSNGRCTKSDVVGAKMSCLANAHDLSNMSSKLLLRIVLLCFVQVKGCTIKNNNDGIEEHELHTSFLRPPPSKQQRIIIVALHPHLIDQLQSSRKSFSLKNLCEPAVSNSTMSYSVKSREGSRMGEKMSNEVSFASRSNGGCTSHDSTSTSHPAPRGLVNANNTSTSKGITGDDSHLMSSSFGQISLHSNPWKGTTRGQIRVLRFAFHSHLKAFQILKVAFRSSNE
ncbi:hypothetical protein POTOM_056435 [Populus tomentosa]|uniref:Uncharacterized protein n=1 Tax=Populus tomentosa TaxID=118781 RepID=A0A8X7XUQ7_POPTO|nr:hypothetical protein POTOM_056435 [Populus tomentosa]